MLVTLHRPALVDGPLLGAVMEELDGSPSELPVVFPVHPRTRARLDGAAARCAAHALEPLGYLEFLSLEADAGGRAHRLRRGAGGDSYLGVPCFTLRSTTERPVTVRLGTNTLLGLDPAAIRQVALPDAPVERRRSRHGTARRPNGSRPWSPISSIRIRDVLSP